MMAHQTFLPPNSQQCIFLLQSKAKFLPLNSVLKFPATTASFTHCKSVGQGRGRLQATTHEHVSRPLADFPSTIWKDSDISFFASAASRISEFDQKYGRQVEELKDKVKEMLFAPTHDSAEKVSLINSLFRLGVSYHFEAEIEEQLDHIFESQPNFADNNDYDLYTVALLFRVFRERGYKISCGVFDKFMDDDGKFKETLMKDAKGMLSLYDAAHLRVHGEDILEEALAFTKAHLKTYSSAASEDRSSSPSHLAKQIMKALEMPLHKGIPRLEALQYMISFCGEEEGEKNDQTSSLLLFAKLDFNRVQLLHQQELYHLRRWWKDLNLVSELSYARDRIMETYFWIVAVYFQPCFARARIIFTKTVKFTSLIDDTYDAYGTIEELRCFTDAIQRWDTSALDELPNYMKILYSALLNLFEEINSEVTKEGRSYGVSQTKEMLKEMVSAYHLEAEWFNQNYVPPFDEYLDNAIVSAGCYTLTAAAFVGMGEIEGIDAFNWLQGRPKIIKDSYTVVRIIDDIITHEFEQKRGHVASAVDCYMKHYGISRDESVEKLRLMVEDAWKDMNEECCSIKTAPVLSMRLLIFLPIVNIARLTEVTYKDVDKYTNPQYLKDYITQLFIDPVPI
ncbi:hypothetical protein ACOSQ3_017776 [Xanthoceras sorbifolium]